MQPITLPRDGRRPLQFVGARLAESFGRDYGKNPTRWYDLVVYQAVGGRYILWVDYTSQWDGEVNHAAAEDFPSLDALAEYLERFDPCAWVHGFKHLIAAHPEGNHSTYAGRQARLEWGIRECFQAQVSELCRQIGITESLEPDKE